MLDPQAAPSLGSVRSGRGEWKLRQVAASGAIMKAKTGRSFAARIEKRDEARLVLERLNEMKAEKLARFPHLRKKQKTEAAAAKPKPRGAKVNKKTQTRNRKK